MSALPLGPDWPGMRQWCRGKVSGARVGACRPAHQLLAYWRLVESVESLRLPSCSCSAPPASPSGTRCLPTAHPATHYHVPSPPLPPPVSRDLVLRAGHTHETHIPPWTDLALLPALVTACRHLFPAPPSHGSSSRRAVGEWGDPGCSSRRWGHSVDVSPPRFPAEPPTQGSSPFLFCA